MTLRLTREELLELTRQTWAAIQAPAPAPAPPRPPRRSDHHSPLAAGVAYERRARRERIAMALRVREAASAGT